jgi:hypothetical protein
LTVIAVAMDVISVFASSVALASTVPRVPVLAVRESLEAFWVNTSDRIILAVRVPVVAVLDGVTGEETADARIVVAVAEQLQAAVAVALVALRADEAEGVAVVPVRLTVMPNAS